MRHLDDELRKAFGREEPSPDFTDRVMERVAVQSPTAQADWRRRFFLIFEPPLTRWAAIGAAALLLIVIGVIGYQKSRHAEDQQANTHEQTTPAPEQPKQQATDPPQINPPEKVAPLNEDAKPRLVNHKPKARPNRTLSAEEREERREGLEAKRKLLLALQVTSFTLNEAQRIVREDRAGRDE